MRAEFKINKFKMAPLYRIDRGKMIFLISCFISLQILTRAHLKCQYITQTIYNSFNQYITVYNSFPVKLIKLNEFPSSIDSYILFPMSIKIPIIGQSKPLIWQ
jgi:hypothetical protein